MSVMTTIELPQDVVTDLDIIAHELGVPREAAIRILVARGLDREKRWKLIQSWGQSAAERFRLKNEDDVEEFMDSLDDVEP